MKKELVRAIENATNNKDKVEIRVSVNSFGWLASINPDALEVYGNNITIHYGANTITMELAEVNYDEIEEEFFFEDRGVLVVFRF